MSVYHYVVLAIAIFAFDGCISSHIQNRPCGPKDGEIIENWGVTQYRISIKILSRLGLQPHSTNEEVRSALLKYNIDISKYGEAAVYEGGSSLLVKSFDTQRNQVAVLIKKLEKAQ